MMQCSYPPPLSEDQLSDALDGRADSAVQAHLSQCAYCAARLEEARHLEWALNRQLYHWDSPDIEQLADYVMGMLSESDNRQIEAYLKTSPSAREEVERLRQYLNIDALTVKAAPPKARLRLPPLDEIIAVFMPKTLQPALRGSEGTARGELTAQGRGITVFVEYIAEGERCTITGQVMASDPETWNGALAQLLSESKLVASALLEGAGEFRFSDIPPGEYDLRIASESNRVIVIHELKIDL